jgi:hypothetical protein
MSTKPYFLTLLVLTLFGTSCNKDVEESQIANSPDFIKVLNMNIEGAGSLSSEDNGGYSFLFAVDVNNTYKDIGICFLDKDANNFNYSTAGGEHDEIFGGYAVGEDGSRYVVGSTYSPELRMDTYTSQIFSPDAYIAKFDKGGNLLWQRGYCDTTAGVKGSREDAFLGVVYRNGKVYCFGRTETYSYVPTFPSPDNWLVVFDESGNKLEDKILPSLRIGTFPAQRPLSLVELEGGDIIIHQGIANSGLPRPQDSSAMMLRYNFELDSVMWTEYYLTTSIEGDPFALGTAENGDIIALNFDNSSLIRYSSTDGHVISTQSTNFTSGQSGLTYIVGSQEIFRIGGFNYVIGSVGGGLAYIYAGASAYANNSESRPWIMKIADDGEIVFSKSFDIPNATFSSMMLDASGNLKLMGGIQYFDRYLAAPFFMTISPEGEIIHPN